MDFSMQARLYSDPELMATAYLKSVFGDEPILFPINPFELLRREGIVFSLADFNKLEGIYIPSEGPDDLPAVAINANRPITRQRFTAMHELCHHFRDAGKQICAMNGLRKTTIETFAEKFAAAVLMPRPALLSEVKKRWDENRNVSFEAILEIADYFGVSFKSCVFRIAYQIHAIEGDTESSALNRRIKRFKPDKVRAEKHMTYEKLYAQLIDNYTEQLAFVPTEYAKNRFQNEYIYNDSRMEGLSISLEEASEIVTDLRLNTQNSSYCSEENEAFMSVAGHYAMYSFIFAESEKPIPSVFDTFMLHRRLFSCYPAPEFGGSIRQTNTLVLGAKFETVDYRDIFPELTKLDAEVREMYAKRDTLSVSDIIRGIVRTHHRITVIHPFSEGNGRTSRAFMNTQLVGSKLPPIYIRVEEKPVYINALAYADSTGKYEALYEIVFKEILRSHVALTETGF